jgi:YggT family protein
VTGSRPVSTVLVLLLDGYRIVLLAHVIFSWVPRMPEPLVPFQLGVRRLVDPVLAPLRRVIPPLRLGGVALDLSIIVLFFGDLALPAAARGCAAVLIRRRHERKVRDALQPRGHRRVRVPSEDPRLRPR